MTHRTPSDILDSIRPGMSDRLREACASPLPSAAKPNRADASSGVGTAATRSAGMVRNRVLALLKDGRPRTVADVARACQIDERIAESALAQLAAGRHLKVTKIEKLAVFEVRR